MRILVLSILMMSVSPPIPGQMRLPRLISNGMVLERDARVKLWGWAANHEKVSVVFSEITATNNTPSPLTVA